MRNFHRVDRARDPGDDSSIATSHRPRMSHVHAFHSWTFREPVETGTFTTRPVLEDAQPIVDVFHDSNGDWQFLCGTTLEFDDLKLVCLGCMVERPRCWNWPTRQTWK